MFCVVSRLSLLCFYAKIKALVAQSKAQLNALVPAPERFYNDQSLGPGLLVFLQACYIEPYNCGNKAVALV